MSAAQTVEAGAVIDRLNRLDADAFAATVADIYEHSPWVAAQAASQRPFATIEAMAATMQAIVYRAGPAAQLALLRAHPELGQGGKQGDDLTVHSSSEQRFAGIDRLTPALAATLAGLNRSYRARYGFPFIVAVRGQKDALAIIGQIERRMDNTPETEIATALDEVGQIARFRLDQLAESER